METAPALRLFVVHEGLSVPSFGGPIPVEAHGRVIPVEGEEGVTIDPAPYIASKLGLGAPNEAHLQVYVEGELAGYVTWGKSYYWDNVIEPSKIHVLEKFQRRGLATVLWRAARTADPMLEHSEVRSAKGQAWAESTGDELPEPHFSSEQERQEHWEAHPEGWEEGSFAASHT